MSQGLAWTALIAAGLIASLVETCKLYGVNPHAWLADELSPILGDGLMDQAAAVWA